MSRFKKSFWLSWIFKISAILHINATLFTIFLLSQILGGSHSYRFEFISTNQVWVFVAWISSMIAIFSIVVTFSVFIFVLDQSFRIILYCAWFISVLAAVMAFLCHFVQITIIPSLLEWVYAQPSIHVMNHIKEWESLLNQVFTFIIPICFAISGFFFTMVMFYTQKFPKKLSWWSFYIWTFLLLGVLFLKWWDQTYLLYASLILLMYVPWLWKVGESLKPDFSG